VVACGGFSYGDTLGAGIGWARSITFNPALADQFSAFFGRSDTFGLGVCNGCQMFAELADIIPGAHDWPRFTTNQSERFEARLSMVEVLDSPIAVFCGHWPALRMPIAVAHGEGFANFSRRGDAEQAMRGHALCRPPRCRDRSLPLQPQWKPWWVNRCHHRGRPFHRLDAAPGACVSQRPDELVGAGCASAQPLDAALAQRAALGRLTPPRAAVQRLGCSPTGLPRTGVLVALP